MDIFAILPVLEILSQVFYTLVVWVVFSQF